MPTIGTADPEIKESLDQIQNSLSNAQTKEQLMKVVEDLNNMTLSILNNHNSAPDLMTKLKSRKFWVAIFGAIAGFLGMVTSGSSTLALCIFGALSAVSVVGYFFTEGTIDANRTKEMIKAATSIAEVLTTMGPILQDSLEESSDENPANEK